MNELAIGLQPVNGGARAARGGSVARSAQHGDEHLPIENGYMLRIDGEGERTETVLSMVASERECCPFFRFEIVIEPAGGPIWLTLTGPSGKREFIDSFIEART